MVVNTNMRKINIHMLEKDTCQFHTVVILAEWNEMSGEMAQV